ncbi:alpha/beta hydrolase family esterase [Nocardia nova]|uniref:alpha/beta hydrolase family esterase n=1 Tax=Nocardia nova TaxID=37330 RepID=UPI001894A08C|nr:hypothetical protein [Nocardia nova]MBF6148941.1 hypothetical protein [Nocardia nova]
MSAELIPGELTHDGRRRSFHLRPPRDPDSPLIVALHGNIGPDAEGGGLLMHDWTRFADHAEEWGVGVVYPDGCHGSWADGRGVTAAKENGVDDVGFLRTLIDWCAEKFRTASDRTLVAGISNGAFMSHRLALECSERVAVFAAVAGALPADLTAVRPTHAVSAMLINGDADPLVPLAGGHSRHRGPDGEPRGRILGAAASAEHWASLDRCADERTTVTTAGSRRITAAHGIGDTAVTAWTVVGGGHTWPGVAVPEEWAGAPGAVSTLEFDATVEIHHFARPLLRPAARRLRPPRSEKENR